MIRDGNEEAFSILFKKYYEVLFQFGGRFLKDWEASENIVQEVFVRFWLDKEKIDIKSNVKAYLFTAVKNRSLTYLLHQKKQINIDERISLMTDNTDSPEEAYIIKEKKNAVARAINQLPEKCRQVYIMNRYDNLSYREISEILDISLNTVKTHMKRALKSLFEKLKDLPL